MRMAILVRVRVRVRICISIYAHVQPSPAPQAAYTCTHALYFCACYFHVVPRAHTRTSPAPQALFRFRRRAARRAPKSLDDLDLQFRKSIRRHRRHHDVRRTDTPATLPHGGGEEGGEPELQLLGMLQPSAVAAWRAAGGARRMPHEQLRRVQAAGGELRMTHATMKSLRRRLSLMEHRCLSVYLHL